jgi:hypothetical protein
MGTCTTTRTTASPLVFDAEWGGYWVRDYPDRYYRDGHYYWVYSGRWHRADPPNGPWASVEVGSLPAKLDRHCTRIAGREAHESWRDAREDARDDRRQVKHERREERQDALEERREDRRDARGDRPGNESEAREQARDDRPAPAKQRSEKRKKVAEERPEDRREGREAARQERRPARPDRNEEQAPGSTPADADDGND